MIQSWFLFCMHQLVDREEGGSNKIQELESFVFFWLRSLCECRDWFVIFSLVWLICCTNVAITKHQIIEITVQIVINYIIVTHKLYNFKQH